MNRSDVREIPYPNYFDFEEEFNDVGTEGGVVFDGGKKPIAFIRQIMTIATSEKDCTVLDFFAGSGSTMHAIIDMNRDGGSRKVISVQSADKTYEVANGEKRALKGCENAFNAGFDTIIDITHKRGENVMCGYEDNSGNAIPGLGGNLRYYRTAFVGKHGCAGALDEDRSELAEKAGCLLALAEDTLQTESVAKKNAKYWQHYSDGAHRHTLIYYSDDLAGFEALSKKADTLRAADKAARIAVYVFTIGSVDAFENEFDDMRHITIKPIPEPILEIYKTINEG